MTTKNKKQASIKLSASLKFIVLLVARKNIIDARYVHAAALPVISPHLHETALKSRI